MQYPMTPLRPRPRLARAALACVGLLCGPAAARAQQVPGLTLEQAVRATLDSSPAIQIAREDVAAARGAQLSAGVPFDPALETTVSGGRDEQHVLTGAGGVSPSAVVTRTTAYRVGVSAQTRFGVLLTPSVEVTRTGVNADEPTASARVNLAVGVPLLRDRGGVATRAPERAAGADYAAAVLDLRHQTALSVHASADAFWAYLAAGRRLDVYRQAEERAERLAAETRELVAADERPAADLNPLLATLASKRIARISAEQEEIAARRRLGLSMGLSPAAVSALGPAQGSFPAAVAFDADSAAVARLVATALAGRADLQAAGAVLQGAEVRAAAARQTLRPRLDLNLGVGYAGLQTGGGLGGFLVDPLYTHVPGLTLSLGAAYRMPLAGAEGRGASLQYAAAVARQRAARAALEREVATAVHTGAQALERASLTVQAARGSIELYRTTLENERTKHALGAATLFEILYAEDNLTNAMLTLVATELAYAHSVLDLRLETATLLGGSGAEVEVDLGALLTPP